MLVILNKTYNGKEGLFVGGHPVEMTKSKLEAVLDDCAARKETMTYRVVKDGQPVNRPAKKQKGTPENKQQTGEQTK